MRITCLIDSLNSGGAQRQMSMLAVLLKEQGHDVRVVTYYPFDFFRPILDQAGVPVQCVRRRSKLHRIWAVGKAVRAGNPDVVIAYLPIPNMIAEVGSIPRRDYALIVSERSIEFPATDAPNTRLRFWLHRFADAVVTNSRAQEAVVRDLAPQLASRVVTIMNCVDLEAFRPAAAEEPDRSKDLRILCMGRFEPVKNHLRLLEVMELLRREHPEIDFRVDAYGNNHFIDGEPGPLSGRFLELKNTLARSPVRGRFRLHDPVADVLPLYQGASALCLASLYEACPNVICEAMACGKPILASRVGDNPVLVEEGKNGFLFDPNSPREIANCILRFSELAPEQRSAMGKASRQRAEEMLSPQRFVDEYERLILRLRRRGA